MQRLPRLDQVGGLDADVMCVCVTARLDDASFR